MPVPSFDQFVFPLLKVLYKHPNGLQIKAAYTSVADDVGLSKKERAEYLPSGQQLTYHNRIGWAQDRLKRKGLSSTPTRGVWCLTPEGRAFFEKHKNGINKELLKTIWNVPKASEAEEETTQEATAVQSPEERIDAAHQELNESTRAELLEKIEQSSPEFFERLVLDVLKAMGYGAERGNAKHIGGSGDGGVDGVISLDTLGLEKVYIQAKRWKDKVVGRPDLQAFFGALAGNHAKKGVFITTSSYSKEAEKFASQVDIVLLNGQELAGYMIDYGVGVSTSRTVKICKIDNDYFEE